MITQEDIARITTAATSAGMNADVAVRTVQAVRESFPIEGRNGRRAKRATRREAIRVGFEANAIPGWVKALWTIARALVPPPWGAIIDSILWVIDSLLDVA